MPSHGPGPHTNDFFLWLIFAILLKNKFGQRNILSKFLFLQEIRQKSAQLLTTWKGAQDFSTFHVSISPNLAKYSYGWLPLEQHHEIGKILKKHWSKRAFSLGGEFHQNEKQNWGCELRPLQRPFFLIWKKSREKSKVFGLGSPDLERMLLQVAKQ